MNKLFEINDYELLSKKVYRILKARIIKGDLAQGDKLFEAKIAEQLGVSRTPVREALRELAAEGFVTMSPNQGMVVNKPSIKDIREVLQIRGALEGLALRLAAEKITQGEIGKLENIIKEMNNYSSNNSSISNNVLTFSKLDAKFHNLILDICANSRLKWIYANLKDLIERFRINAFSIPGTVAISINEHREILDALRKGDWALADRLGQKHMETAISNICENKTEKM